MRSLSVVLLIAGFLVVFSSSAAAVDPVPAKPAAEQPQSDDTAKTKQSKVKAKQSKTKAKKADFDQEHSGGTVHCDLCTTYCTETVCDPKCHNVRYECGTHSCNCRPGS